MHDAAQRIAHALDLPTIRSQLFGRAADVRAVRDLLIQDHARIVTLTGPGGVGKTRLAIEVASIVSASFDDAVVVVPLATVRDVERVPDAMAAAFGVAETGSSETVEAIINAVGDRLMLLLLDNLEHVIDAAAVVSDLARGCRGLQLLLTSRVPLRLSGEYEYPVAPLSVISSAGESISDPSEQPAVQLFAERARAVRPSFSASAENVDAIAEIVRRLDGLPLAIELAAARTKVMSPSALLSRLSSSLSLLASGPRDAPERLQSMRDAIGWSYDLLDHEQQRVFRALGIFSGRFSLSAAEEVAGVPEAESLDRLGALVDQSLVVAVDSDSEEARFALLETIREFANERLEAAGERDYVAERHAHHYERMAKAHAGRFFTAGELEAMNAIEQSAGDLRLALDWLLKQDVERAAEVMYAAWYFWGVRGHYREALDWLARLEPHRSRLSDVLDARISLAHGFMLWATGQYEAALQSFDLAEAVFRRCHLPHDVAMAGFGRGSVYRDREQYTEAKAELVQVLDAFEQLGDKAWMGFSLSVLGTAARGLGDLDGAQAYFERGLAITRAIPYPGGMSPIVDDLGDLARDRGEFAAALDYYRQTMAIWVQLRDPHAGADSLAGFAVVLSEYGDDETAARLLGSVMAAYRQLLFPPSRYGAAFKSGAVEQLRQRMGEQTFQAAWSAGERIPLFDAMRSVLDYHPAPPAPPSHAEASRSWWERLGLTPREREILDLLIDGRTNAEIGESLYISPRTAGTHVSNIFAKLGVSSRAAAVGLAMRSKGEG